MVFRDNKTRKGGSRSSRSSRRHKAAKKIQGKARTRQHRRRSKAATKLQTRGRMLRAKRLARQEKEIDDEQEKEIDDEIEWIRQSGDTGTNYRNM